jgi:hypothetical protein
MLDLLVKQLNIGKADFAGSSDVDSWVGGRIDEALAWGNYGLATWLARTFSVRRENVANPRRTFWSPELDVWLEEIFSP